MPTAKLTVASFMDHGIIAAAPTARTIDEDVFTAAPAATPGDTMTMVMTAAKDLKVSKVEKAELTISVGALLNAAKTPLEVATVLINARHSALDGASGPLGATQGNVTQCPDGIGFYRHYKNGSIYWSPAAGAHAVWGAIRQKWAALGWERSFLGYPTTSETVGKDPKGEGRFNHFQGGSIYWHPQPGAKEVHGAIRAKYLELGAEASVLGYPTTDETKTPDQVGRYNHFQRGSIYWTPTTWAQEVHGLIRGHWAETGWERGPLGYPLTDELVPHRSIGYTPAPTIAKPLDLPADVFKLPTEQPPPDLKVVAIKETVATPVTKSAVTTRAATGSTAVVTTKTLTVAPAPSVAAPSTAKSTASATKTTAAAKPAAANSTITSVTAVKIGSTAELVAVPVLTANPSIFINDHKGRSDDRFGDFENGVLFWQRRTNKVLSLNPRAKTPSGTKCAFTAAEIMTLAFARIKAALGSLPGTTIGAASFAGTTAYSWDGASVRNRAHRIRFNLSGKRPGTSTTITATVECRAEISFDPVDRELVGYLTSWSLPVNPGDFTSLGNISRALHTRLDPAMWKQFSVIKLPATQNDPIAILSVKTQIDGRVSVYFEP